MTVLRRWRGHDPAPALPGIRVLCLREPVYDAFNKLGADHLQPSISWPRYFLLCHSIELALKAYLAKLGATPLRLQFEFGHKLAELVDEVVGKGLRLTPETQGRIKALAKVHSNYWHRYPWEWENSDGVYVIEQFIRAAHELIDEVCKEVHGVSWEDLERTGGHYLSGFVRPAAP